MAAGLTDEEAEQLCSVQDPDTKDYIFQQTMYRIKDPRRSLPFYSRGLGMTLLRKLDFPEARFSLYFLGHAREAPPREGRTAWALSQPATLELTHNWGGEEDFHSGNEAPRGFGHIGIMVPDVRAACDRLEKMGVEFVKRPEDGKMKGIAFVKDPDGYWVEIFNAGTVATLTS